MAIIVEDGSLVASANSYVTSAELTTFATARGVTLVLGGEELLIRAMDYVEGLDFFGIKYTSTQALQWPRTGVYIDGYYVNNDDIPQELKDGLMHTAIAIDESNDPLQDAPRKVIREKLEGLETQYSDASSAVVMNKKILNAFRKLIAGGNGGNTFTVRKA